MNVEIRKERAEEYEAVDLIIKEAFSKAEHADGTEHELVAKLRRSEEFIADLSLVAVLEGTIVGHILLTPITIEEPTGKIHRSLALAPVSVDPKYQNRGIGGKLIKSGHEKAMSLGFTSVILLGHPEYYPRFGYKRASFYRVYPPFEVPDEAFMAIELVDGALADVSGTVKYPPAFDI